jgi:hypothetical protein
MLVSTALPALIFTKLTNVKKKNYARSYAQFHQNQSVDVGSTDLNICVSK